MGRSVFIVVGVLVALVIVLSGLVGFFYGQSTFSSQNIVIETKTVRETITTTKIVTTTFPPITISSTRNLFAKAYEEYNKFELIIINCGTNIEEVTDILVNGIPIDTIEPQIKYQTTRYKDRVPEFFDRICPFIIVPNETITMTVNFSTLKFENPYEIVLKTSLGQEYPVIVKWFYPLKGLEITSAYATQIGINAWTISIHIRNGVFIDRTITEIFVNGKPSSTAGLSGTTNFTLKAGASISLTYTLTGPYYSGQTIEIKLHTSNGEEYPKAVVLP
ncbi:MAG: hypothetical protein QXE05_04150 [Nitrososphaeria archaeon]